VRNIALCSQLQEVHRSLVTLLPRLPGPAAAALSTPLEALQATAIDSGTVAAAELRSNVFRQQWFEAWKD
jgi:hypothetical protein